MSTPRTRRPLWPTLLVLVGSVALVAFFLSTMGTRTDSTPEAAASDSPAASAASSPSVTPQPGAGAGEPSQQPRPTATPPPTVDPELLAPVVVVNQTDGAGLGARAAEAINAGGWPIDSVASGVVGAPSTTLYVPAGLEAQAQAFLAAFPAVQRQRPAFEGLAEQGLTLVLAEPDAVAVVDGLEQRGFAALSPAASATSSSR